MKDWCEEVAEDGFGARESVERANSGRCAYRNAEVEEADGGSSRARKSRCRYPCSWR